ncbi:MAG: hypothetical protein R3Y54_06830 [Eubacteriales bacterium]
MEAINQEQFIGLNYLKKENFHGSMKGMRYRFHCEKVDDGTKLEVCIWPEPYCFEKTEDAFKQVKEYTFDEQGLLEGIAWVNEQYLTQEEMWKIAKNL